MRSVILLVLIAPVLVSAQAITGCDNVQQGSSCIMKIKPAAPVSLRGSGSLSCSPSCSAAKSATFTAPVSVSAYNGLNYGATGVPIRPIDSIFGTRIDSLPTATYSNQWVTNIGIIEPITQIYLESPEFGMTVVDNTTATTSYKFAYGGPASMPNPPRATWNRQQGNWRFNDGTDHHTGFVNRQTGQVYELFGDVFNSNDGSGTGAASGIQYGAYSTSRSPSPGPYAQVNGSATGNAGMEYLDLVLTANDALYGLNHPLSWVFPEFAPNQPCAKCVATTGKSPNGVAGQMSDCGYSWPATYTGNNCGGSFNPPSGTGPGLGSWMRLKKSWCAKNLRNYTGVQLNILTGLCHYGAILTDWGHVAGIGNIKADLDIYSSPVIMSALHALDHDHNGELKVANWEFVDVSALSPNSTWWDSTTAPPKMYAAVKPNNGYVALSTFSVVTAGSTVKHIAVLPVSVGTLSPFLIIPAGSQASYQITAYVLGTSNQSVTCSGTNVNSSCLFTIPASETTPTNFDITVTATADTKARCHVNITVIPNPPVNSGTIYIDSGVASGTTTDTAGHVWTADGAIPTLASGEYNPYPSGITDKQPWSNSVPFYQQYKTAIKTVYGGDVVYGDFVLPAGNYRVTVMSEPLDSEYTPCINRQSGVTSILGVQQPSNFFDVGQLILTANSSITGHVEFGLHNAVANFRCQSPQSYTFPAKVDSTGILKIGVRGQTQRTADNSAQLGGMHFPWVNGVYISPDTTTTPHWAIDTQDITNLVPGQKLQMYLIDWYTGSGSTNSTGANGYPIKANDLAGDAKWSVMPGGVGGTINSDGLYTAPSSLTTTGTDTIKISNASYSATVRVSIRRRTAPFGTPSPN